ncbi:PREDICTED: prolactin-inducible protein [Miniopterus natalensis]|uniref:prolactin-inducible protein n=1 Tax=Miniopterus natalensis TaxID=291302 RepID=UPI0007A6BF01|nr:PREDICTED: prolactin-inducible protein [Miniopterus natalensis]
MHSLQLLLRASHAALLLVLCLQLGTNKAQEDTRQLVKMNFQMPPKTVANEETTVKLRVETELRECMVMKTYLKSSRPMEGPFNYKYTACLCDDYPRTFFWDFAVNNTVRIAAVVDIVRELNICPNDMAVVPIKANRFSIMKTLTVI